MRLSQKKNCNGCTASGNSCELGYKRKSNYFHCAVYGYTPLEPCYKPKTINEYIELRAKRYRETSHE